MAKIKDTRTLAYPSPLGAVVLAHVLTEDATGKLGAYSGILPDAATGKFDFEWIAHHGAKLTEREAFAIFSFKKELYRH